MSWNLSSVNSTSLNIGYSRLDSSSSLNRKIQELSSASQITGAADGSAEKLVSQQFTVQNVNFNQFVRNLNDGINFLQTTEGALENLLLNTRQLNQLSAQASSNDLSTANRNALQNQANNLSKSNLDIINNTQFNGQALLQGVQFNFQIGSDAQLQFSSAKLDGAVGLNSINGIDLSSVETANDSWVATINDINAIGGQRENLVNFRGKIEGVIQDRESESANKLAVEQRSIADADSATEMSKFIQNSFINNAELATQIQARAIPEQVLILLR